MRPLIVAASVLLMSQLAFSAQYKIDPDHTFVMFKVGHLGFTNAYGRFPGVEGTFTIDEKKPEKSKIDVKIKADSVSTHQEKRDQHLKSPDFFNVKQFPYITFKSTKVVKQSGGKYEITGDLTLHGVTKPITFTFTQMKTGKDPWGNMRTGGEGSFTIKRSDYGMKFMLGEDGVHDEVTVTLAVEGFEAK